MRSAELPVCVADCPKGHKGILEECGFVRLEVVSGIVEVGGASLELFADHALGDVLVVVGLGRDILGSVAVELGGRRATCYWPYFRCFPRHDTQLRLAANGRCAAARSCEAQVAS